MNESVNLNNTVEEGKMIAIVSYLTLIGLIIAFVMNSEKKNSYGRYHIRQSLGLALFAVSLMVIGIIPILGWIISILGFFLIVVMWLIGLMNAINGKEKPLPVLGVKFEEWFKNI